LSAGSREFFVALLVTLSDERCNIEASAQGLGLTKTVVRYRTTPEMQHGRGRGCLIASFR
jgi:hypothetical protein